MTNKLVERIFGGPSPKNQVDDDVEIEDDAPAVVEDAVDERAEERARISAILNCDEADGKLVSAKHLALKTSLSAEDAIAVLAGVEAPKAESNLDTRMEDVNTDVGADAGEAPEPKAQTLAGRASKSITVQGTSLAGRMKTKGES